MAATGRNVVRYVSELVYGDLGVGELGTPAPAGAKNHIHWTRDNKPASFSTTVTGDGFLAHHLDYMLARYEAWRSKYFLPPVRPWDGQSPMNVEQVAAVPGAGPLPATTGALGDSLRRYYNGSFRGVATETLGDEIKACFSYRYWAFAKWMSDLRKRVRLQPVLHVHPVYGRDGTVLSEKDFTDLFNPLHHVWHPNKPRGTGWTRATPFFKTAAGQREGKKEISATQFGSEFFRFHREHLELFDRWLERAGLNRMESVNMCAHDTGPNALPPIGVEADLSGHPHIESWLTDPPTVVFDEVHTTYWEGDLREFSNLGEMGQLFAANEADFPRIPVSGVSDTGYHGEGHNLNGDIRPPPDNNHSPRFFAWHHFNDDVWKKREPRFNAFQLLQADNTDFPQPRTMTILRDLNTGSDSVEPANGVAGLNLANGQGTLRIKLNVRPDPFGRTLDLLLRCDVLREAGGTAPVISLSRQLSMIPGGVPTSTQRQQNTDFLEDFVFGPAPGTRDADGDGPFKSDNLLFSPTPVGFKNSRIRVTAQLTCRARPDGSVQAVTGTIASTGLAVSGAGTSFTAELRQGDLLRAGGQVRETAVIDSANSLTLLEPFAPDLPAGTTFERLDGFDHESALEIELIQEKLAPHITSYLDRSSFSVQQVAASGTTVFDNAFYVVLQDRSARPYSIAWPASVEPQLYGLIAPRVHAAGIYTDPAHRPALQLRDAATGVPIEGVAVSAAPAQPEDPALHPALAQRVTFPCTVTFTGQAAFAGLSTPGAFKDVKLAVTATDRCGNQVTDDSLRVRLQFNPNAYMLDGAIDWLSADTRVFRIEQGQARFGVAAGWTDPHAFLAQAVANFRAGGGVAGGEPFDTLPVEGDGARLEYATSVAGINIHNFALAQTRLLSATGLDNLRVTFRLFRWGTASVEFNPTLAYRSAASGIGLLGRTGADELASIPFFAAPRVAPSAAMDTQTDPLNLFTFGSTGAAEARGFFGAYLDVNQSTARFPQTYTGDGPHAGTLLSIRDLLEDHHQCMVVEIVHALDPTMAGSTPGTSDNLAQRNLLIVQSANPGSEITRTVQHAFNIDFTRSLQRPGHDRQPIVDPILHHRAGVAPMHDGAHGDGRDRGQGGHVHLNCCEEVTVLPARPAGADGAHAHHDLQQELAHLEQSWLAQSPPLLQEAKERLIRTYETEQRWRLDPEQWKPTTGLDELAFFWNNLPAQSEVELYLPAANVEEIFNFRSLRHAADTVGIVDSQTLRLFPTGTTFLPLARFWGDNLAALLKVKLPAGIQKGQRFRIDVLQMRADEARTLGGFRLGIEVEKADRMWEAERRTLELFHKRMSLKPRADRWWPIVERQVQFTRARAEQLVALANEEQPGRPPVVWRDPTEVQHGRKVRVVLEKIRIDDDREPFFKGKGEFRFHARVWAAGNGGLLQEVVLPAHGHYHVGDRAGSNEVTIDAVLFDNWVDGELAIQIGGVERDTFDPDDRLPAFKQTFRGDPATWFARYAPTGGAVDPQDVNGWKVWFRIAPS